MQINYSPFSTHYSLFANFGTPQYVSAATIRNQL